MADLILMII